MVCRRAVRLSAVAFRGLLRQSPAWDYSSSHSISAVKAETS